MSGEGPRFAGGAVRRQPPARDPPARVREALAGTDWDRHPVDVVHYAPATSLGLEGDRPRTAVHRHAGTPPSPARYATGERTCRVERVTRPLYGALRERE